MKVLLLNQTFHPDKVATAQYLSDLARGLRRRGHQVTVVTSRRAYDQPGHLFTKRETWEGIEIHRLGATGLGKSAKWKRAVDFATFLGVCALKVLTLPRHDVVVALTSPPLISFVGAWVAKLKRGKFFYWVMDLNPDEAIAAGWLAPESFAARMLDRISRFSLRRSHRVIALDRFMSERVQAKGIPAERVLVLPPWAQEDTVRFDAPGRERFRAAHDLSDKFVVMYSGNHSPCHPLETLLDAARRLSGQADIQFCFIGGGSEFSKVQQFAGQHGLVNVRCLPYQPREQLSASLSAADLHVVVMGDRFVGTIHPSKIYNILQVGCPFLYIGPRPSHVLELVDELKAPELCAHAEHGRVDSTVRHISSFAERRGRRGGAALAALAERFSQKRLEETLIAELENAQTLPGSSPAWPAAVCESDGQR